MGNYRHLDTHQPSGRRGRHAVSRGDDVNRKMAGNLGSLVFWGVWGDVLVCQAPACPQGCFSVCSAPSQAEGHESFLSAGLVSSATNSNMQKEHKDTARDYPTRLHPACQGKNNTYINFSGVMRCSRAGVGRSTVEAAPSSCCHWQDGWMVLPSSVPVRRTSAGLLQQLRCAGSLGWGSGQTLED